MNKWNDRTDTEKKRPAVSMSKKRKSEKNPESRADGCAKVRGRTRRIRKIKEIKHYVCKRLRAWNGVTGS